MAQVVLHLRWTEADTLTGEDRQTDRHTHTEDSLISYGLGTNQPAARRGAGQHLGFLEDLDEEHAVPHGVDDDEHVPEVGGDDAPAVVAAVLRPHHVHLVVAQVPELQGKWARDYSLLMAGINKCRGSRPADSITLLGGRDISLRKS